MNAQQQTIHDHARAFQRHHLAAVEDLATALRDSGSPAVLARGAVAEYLARIIQGITSKESGKEVLEIVKRVYTLRGKQAYNVFGRGGQ